MPLPQSVREEGQLGSPHFRDHRGLGWAVGTAPGVLQCLTGWPETGASVPWVHIVPTPASLTSAPESASPRLALGAVLSGRTAPPG